MNQKNESSTLKHEITKLFLIDASAGQIYRKLFQGKSVEEREKMLDQIIFFASINNKELKYRIKSLALLDFLLSMSKDDSWKDGNIIYNISLAKIIEDNCNDIIKNKVENHMGEPTENKIRVIQQIIKLLCSVKINKNIKNKFEENILETLKLKEKKNRGELSLKEEYIYNQIYRNKSKYL